MAVFRLITSWNLVGCCTGRSAGRAPLQYLGRIDPELAIAIDQVGPIADEAAINGELAEPPDRRNAIAPFQRHQLFAAGHEQDRVAFDQCVDVLAGERSKDSVDFGFVAGVYDWQLDTLRAGRGFSIRDRSGAFVWVDQQSDDFGARNQFAQQLKPLWRQRSGQQAQTRKVAAGMGKAGDKAFRDWVDADLKDDRDCRGSVFGGFRGGWSKRGDHIDLCGNEIRGQRRQPFKVTLCPSGFDDNGFSVNITVLSEPLSECVDLIGEPLG